MAYTLLPRSHRVTSDPVLARFTEDMAETLRTFFHIYEVRGVVTIQLVGAGLWLVNPTDGSRQFLGQAELTPEEEQARARRLAEAKQKGMN